MRSNVLLQRVTGFCRACIPKGSSVCVAVSGGGDSTALLCLLVEAQKSLRIDRIGVLHVNHGLRGTESDGDERFVRNLAKRFGLPCHVRRLSGRSLTDPGMEEWARSERYRYFADIRRRFGYDFLATGHTADDQAETVIQRIMRGTGLRGLRGILAQREDGVIRPLLGCSRTDLASWLNARGIAWRTDSSNFSPDYQRNRVRHRILPLLESREPGASGRCVSIAAAAQSAWDAMQPGIARWTGAFAAISTHRFCIKKQGLSDGLHAPEALRALFEKYGIRTDSPHIETVIRNRTRSSGTFLLPGGVWRYYPARDFIDFRDETARHDGQFELVLPVPGHAESASCGARFTTLEVSPPVHELPTDNLTVVLDRAVCGKKIVFRTIRPDDRIIPLGRTASVPVSAFLAKQGIPVYERKRCGVVTGKGGLIVWIPGVRISNSARITASTRRALKISYQSFPAIV
jgi:tRNA(Ile)-lysidine synthase